MSLCMDCSQEQVILAQVLYLIRAIHLTMELRNISKIRIICNRSGDFLSTFDFDAVGT